MVSTEVRGQVSLALPEPVQGHRELQMLPETETGR